MGRNQNQQKLKRKQTSFPVKWTSALIGTVFSVLLFATQSFAQIATPAPIPSNIVNLSDYGGNPGAPASTIISAFNQSFSRLKALGGGTLKIAAGTYNFGSVSSAASMVSVSDLSNVAISGYGAQFVMNTTAVVMPVFFSFVNPSNVTIAGVSFTDTGADITVNWRGAVCISVDATRAISKFKVIDVTAEKVVTFFRSQSSPQWLGTEFDINGTIRNAYYGVNTNFTGRFSKMNVTSVNVRRVFITYGARDWNITVNGSSTGAIGSNAYISLTPTGGAPVENVNVNLTYTGPLTPYGGLIHFYNQGNLDTDSWTRNVKANVTLNNVSGTTRGVFLFDHELTSGVVSSTPRATENVTLSGVVNGSFATNMIGVPSVSTNPSSVVYVTQSIAKFQNMAALPSYFKVIADSTSPTTPPPTTTTMRPVTTTTMAPPPTTTLPPASGSAVISNVNLTADATNAFPSYSYTGTRSFLRMFLDTDRNAATGTRIAGIGADYLIENSTLYKYAGTSGEWKFLAVRSSNMVNVAGSSVRWSVLRSDLGNPSMINLVANIDNDDYSAVITKSLSVTTTTPTTTTTTTTTTMPAPSTSWIACANEGGTCSFSGTRQVRYGANGIYAYKTATSSIACDNATFGDPVFGVAKKCEYSSQTLASPTTPTIVGTAINMANVNLEIGFAYLIYQDFGTAGDTSSAPTQSKLQIYENGIALGPAHSLHADIRSLGRGRFSHWGNSLRFSASDNSNPKTNGRVYSYKILP